MKQCLLSRSLQYPFTVLVLVLAGCVYSPPMKPIPSETQQVQSVDDCDRYAIPAEYIMTFANSSSADKAQPLFSSENRELDPLLQGARLEKLSPKSLFLKTTQDIPMGQLRTVLTQSQILRDQDAVERNATVQMLTVPPNDPYYPGKQCALVTMSAERAWEELKKQGTNASGVYVAIVDSGIYDRHPDLKDAVKVKEADVLWHGTHVAGLIGARENDALGMAGVAWKVNLRSYQFLDASGGGKVKDAIKKVSEALSASPAPDVVLLAWGTGCKSVGLQQLIKDYPDVLFVAAAGNERQNIDKPAEAVYPAAYDNANILTVMATTCEDDAVARFSATGKDNVDIAAPGAGYDHEPGIQSTVLRDRYGVAVGTSMAAAYAAGGAALVKALHPAWKAKELKDCLMSAVDPLVGASGNPLAGKCYTEGRLNLGEVVDCR